MAIRSQTYAAGADARRASAEPARNWDEVGLDAATRAQLALCCALEDIADRLPTLPPSRARKAASALRRAAVAPEFEKLREVLAASAAGRATTRDAPLRNALKLIAAEERDDADRAQELSEALDEAARGRRVPNPDALGYLLRSYFEARRRHLAWRGEAVLAPARTLLGEEAVSKLLAVSNDDARALRVIAPLDGDG